MIRVFLVLALFCITLGGCSGIDWFPEQTGSSPDAPAPTVTGFAFTPKLNVTAGSLQTSETITVSISGGSAKISVAGPGTYKIGSGAFTSADGTVNDGDQVTVQHTHTAGTVQVVTTLTIGDKSATFTSTTAGATDNVADFTIPAPLQSNFTVPGTVTSEPFPVVLSGSTPIAISVANGEYSIGTAAFTSSAGTVNNGDEVRVRHNVTVAGRTVSTLTIGDNSATFVSNSVTVADFSFTPITGVPVNTPQTSNTVTLSITGGSAPISVSGGEYQINGGAFTSAAGTVKNSDTVAVRHTSLNVAGGHPTSTTLTVGGKSATFTSTTI